MKSINKAQLHQVFIKLSNKNDLQFNKFYSEYNKLIYCIAFSILKNEDESKDITQNVFEKIWKMNKNKYPTKNEASWLYTVTKNETLTYLRNKKQETNIDDLYYIESEDNALNEIIDKDKYNRIISKLDNKDQEIVSLRILSGFSFKQIARMLNMPIGTVQWKYYKAINTLKTIITNISMFIITIGLYIRRKTHISTNDSKYVENDNENKVQEETQEIHGTTDIHKENQYQQDNESSMQEALPNKTNTQIESVIVQEDNKTVNNYKTSKIDVGLLSAATVFLILSIVFLKIFINHQQNAKKKASK